MTNATTTAFDVVRACIHCVVRIVGLLCVSTFFPFPTGKGMYEELRTKVYPSDRESVVESWRPHSAKSHTPIVTPTMQIELTSDQIRNQLQDFACRQVSTRETRFHNHIMLGKNLTRGETITFSSAGIP